MAIGAENTRKPKKKLTAQDFWNAAYRGFVPGGYQQKPPVATDMGDPPEFDDDVESVVEPDSEPVDNVVPVAIVDDLSHTRRRVERVITTYTQNVGSVSPTQLIGRDPFRTQTIVQNLGPGIVYLGHNNAVGTGGFALGVNSVVVLGTTRALLALQQAGQTGIAQVSVIQEYDKDMELGNEY